MFITDMLFTIAMAFFIWGLIHLIGNMDMFASFAYGTKCLVKLFRGKQDSAQAMKDGYIEYLKNRRHHADVPLLMLFAACFAILSVLVSLFSN